MNIPLIKETVDIYTYPVKDERYQAQENIGITLGDLHGNAIKLIFFLIKHGVMSNISENHYDRLVTIYNTEVNKLTKELLGEFAQIIQQTTINNKATIRLIGDELADRGMGDHYTLWIFKKLHQDNVSLEILYSNHGSDFINYTELCARWDKEQLEKMKFSEDEFSVSVRHICSLTNMEMLIRKRLLSRDEMMDIANKAYKPAVKLFSYSFDEQAKEFFFYSHAPVGQEHIEEMAGHFDVSYNVKTISQLANTIDAINEQFQDDVRNNAMIDNMEGESALFDVVWNRETATLSSPISGILFVHGHCFGYESPQQICLLSLDTLLGKGGGNNQGEYTVLYSYNGSLEHAQKCLLKKKSNKDTNFFNNPLSPSTSDESGERDSPYLGFQNAAHK